MTKGFKIIIGLLVVLILILALAVFLLWQRSWPIQKEGMISNQPTATISPTQAVAVSATAEPNATGEMLVGGDSDEHGCKASAGYIWCEAKKKCLRNWEEPCEADPAEEIRRLMAQIHQRELAEVKITITKKDVTHLAGGVVFGMGGPGEGGMFLAVKQGDVWQIVAEGNGTVDCQKMRSVYGFSDEILKPNFCD